MTYLDAVLLSLSKNDRKTSFLIYVRYLPLYLLYLGISEHSLLGIRAPPQDPVVPVLAEWYEPSNESNQFLTEVLHLSASGKFAKEENCRRDHYRL